MSQTMRWGVGIALMVVACLVYLAEQSWIRSREFEPVYLPVSVTEVTRTPPFEVNLTDGFNIDVWVDSSGMSSASEQDHSECRKCCGYEAKPNLTKKWQLFKGGTVVQSGQTEASHLAV